MEDFITAVVFAGLISAAVAIGFLVIYVWWVLWFVSLGAVPIAIRYISGGGLRWWLGAVAFNITLSGVVIARALAVQVDRGIPSQIIIKEDVWAWALMIALSVMSSLTVLTKSRRL